MITKHSTAITDIFRCCDHDLDYWLFTFAPVAPVSVVPNVHTSLWVQHYPKIPTHVLADVSAQECESIDLILIRIFTEAFIATCSPDELLGQVIQALCPKYHIDAPHLFALRNVVSSAIVAPRKPPQLKRTRPDKRIGELSSVYDTPPRSAYSPNGPPVSANQSFYFHHQDPDFERLLPQVDRSRYVWPDEPASQEDSDDQGISDSQESMQAKGLSVSPSAGKRRIRSQTTVSGATEPVDRRKKTLAALSQQPKTTRQKTTSKQALVSDPTNKVHSIANKPQEDPVVTPQSPRATPIPTITITSPDSKRLDTVIALKDLTTPFSLLQPADIVIDLPDTQDTQIAPLPSVVSVPYLPQSSGSQSSCPSTQNSEVFSPPDAFVNFTPPTQEDSQNMSQAEPSQLSQSTEANIFTTNENTKTYRRGSRIPTTLSPSRAPPPASSLGKRPRIAPADDSSLPASSRKRTKSV